MPATFIETLGLLTTVFTRKKTISERCRAASACLEAQLQARESLLEVSASPLFEQHFAAFLRAAPALIESYSNSTALGAALFWGAKYAWGEMVSRGKRLVGFTEPKHNPYIFAYNQFSGCIQPLCFALFSYLDPNLTQGELDSLWVGMNKAILHILDKKYNGKPLLSNDEESEDPSKDKKSEDPSKDEKSEDPFFVNKNLETLKQIAFSLAGDQAEKTLLKEQEEEIRKESSSLEEKMKEKLIEPKLRAMFITHLSKKREILIFLEKPRTDLEEMIEYVRSVLSPHITNVQSPWFALLNGRSVDLKISHLTDLLQFPWTAILGVVSELTNAPGETYFSDQFFAKNDALDLIIDKSLGSELLDEVVKDAEERESPQSFSKKDKELLLCIDSIKSSRDNLKKFKIIENEEDLALFFVDLSLEAETKNSEQEEDRAARLKILNEQVENVIQENKTLLRAKVAKYVLNTQLKKIHMIAESLAGIFKNPLLNKDLMSSLSEIFERLSIPLSDDYPFLKTLFGALQHLVRILGNFADKPISVLPLSGEGLCSQPCMSISLSEPIKPVMEGARPLAKKVCQHIFFAFNAQASDEDLDQIFDLATVFLEAPYSLSRNMSLLIHNAEAYFQKLFLEEDGIKNLFYKAIKQESLLTKAEKVFIKSHKKSFDFFKEALPLLGFFNRESENFKLLNLPGSIESADSTQKLDDFLKERLPKEFKENLKSVAKQQLLLLFYKIAPNLKSSISLALENSDAPEHKGLLVAHIASFVLSSSENIRALFKAGFFEKLQTSVEGIVETVESLKILEEEKDPLVESTTGESAGAGSEVSEQESELESASLGYGDQRPVKKIVIRAKPEAILSPEIYQLLALIFTKEVVDQGIDHAFRNIYENITSPSMRAFFNETWILVDYQKQLIEKNEGKMPILDLSAELKQEKKRAFALSKELIKEKISAYLSKKSSWWLAIKWFFRLSISYLKAGLVRKKLAQLHSVVDDNTEGLHIDDFIEEFIEENKEIEKKGLFRNFGHNTGLSSRNMLGDTLDEIKKHYPFESSSTAVKPQKSRLH